MFGKTKSIATIINIAHRYPVEHDSPRVIDDPKLYDLLPGEPEGDAEEARQKLAAIRWLETVQRRERGTMVPTEIEDFIRWAILLDCPAEDYGWLLGRVIRDRSVGVQLPRDTKIYHADFLEMDMRGFTAVGATFNNCVFTRTNMDSAQFYGCLFENCTLSEASFAHAAIVNCHVKNSDICGGWQATAVNGLQLSRCEIAQFYPIMDATPEWGHITAHDCVIDDQSKAAIVAAFDSAVTFSSDPTAADATEAWRARPAPWGGE